VTSIVTYLVIEHLVYRDVHEVVRLFEELKKGSRVEEVEINRKKFRLRTFKKLYKGIYSHILSKQYQIDEMTRMAAFRKEFIADVSHELKTPIFAAQGFVHTLLDGAVEDENVRTRFLQKAAKSLDGLDVLVHDLLTLSHIEIGETKMQFEYFDIKGLAEEVLEQFESKRGNRKLELIVKNTSDQPQIVYADWLRIKQVLNNLVSNGIKYSKEDGSVQLMLEEVQDVTYISVQDNGEGIPAEDLKRVFERFYRVDKSRSREKGGTGLGLAIVKHIVEGHHSKMQLESVEGEGSLFKFSLPRGKDKLESK
jgi:two-component system phosphate regulon sensor histidine kinase PhoR